MENSNLDTKEASSQRIAELEYKLQEAQNLVYAIQHGEVDALLMKKNGKPDVYSLESIDYTYRILVEKFAEGAISISEEGLIQYCNSYFSNLINLPINKIIGSHFGLYLSNLESYNTLLNNLSNGVYKGETFLEIQEKRIPVYISITSLEPNLPGFGIILNDQTDKRKSEETILAYQGKLEEKIDELNKNEQQLSKANQELVFQNLEKEKQAVELVKANEELTIQFKEKQKTVAQLRSVNIDLQEQKIAKIKAEAATLVAEESVKAKQQFLANMSHEIRTPMNAIVGFTNVVLKTDLRQDQREYINAIKVSGDALIILINDILDLAKVNAGKMTFENNQFNLPVSISTMLNLFEAKFKEKNLELIKEYDENIPKFLMGDAIRLRQIILNLVSNALKFTSEGTITMSFRMLKENSENATIEFTIIDTGIGIPENRLENIFNNFEQAHIETNNSYGGTGLGLAIVKQLIELQGGKVFVKSKMGKGSTFGFVLSFDKVISETTNEISGEALLVQHYPLSDSPKDVKVLVVEDVVLNQLLIKIILADFGFELDIAGNGKIAIEKLKEHKYDIILMDLHMPEMNGFQTTAYIRNQMNSNIPIIALTADVTSMDVDNCKIVGMNDYISKPIDEALLYSKMIKHLKKND